MRQEIKLKLNDKGVDKTFLIKEMPATKHEDWLFKLLLSLGNKISNSNILDMLSNIKYEDMKQLKDELWECVFIVTQDGMNMQASDMHILDVVTKLKLSKAAFELHVKPLTEGLSITLGQDQV